MSSRDAPPQRGSRRHNCNDNHNDDGCGDGGGSLLAKVFSDGMKSSRDAVLQGSSRRRNRNDNHNDDGCGDGGGSSLAKRLKTSIDSATPPITVFIEDAHGLGIPDHTLPPNKLELYKDLQAELTRVSEEKGGFRGEAKTRLEDDEQDILAAIGLLFVMDDKAFETWLRCNPIKYCRTETFVNTYARSIRRVLDDWLQTKVKSEEKSVTRRSGTTLTAQQLVREWYGEKCILTGHSTVEACHILPDCIERHERRAKKFWGSLAMFWPSKDQEQLMELLKQPDHEKVNLVILDRNNHCLWGSARFALRPLEAGPDPHEMRLQFLWLNPVRSDTEILNYKEGEDKICDGRDRSEKHTRRIIQSGDIVHLTTCNTNEYPLPHRGLLELQWHLNRVVRAVANADFLRLIFRDDEESPEVGTPAESAENDEGEYDFAELAGVTHSPYFSLYLINCALERGLIQDSDVPLWKRRLIPWGEDADAFDEDDEDDEGDEVDEDGKDNKADEDNKDDEDNMADEDNKDWSTEKSLV